VELSSCNLVTLKCDPDPCWKAEILSSVSSNTVCWITQFLKSICSWVIDRNQSSAMTSFHLSYHMMHFAILCIYEFWYTKYCYAVINSFSCLFDCHKHRLWFICIISNSFFPLMMWRKWIHTLYLNANGASTIWAPCAAFADFRTYNFTAQLHLKMLSDNFRLGVKIKHPIYSPIWWRFDNLYQIYKHL